MKPALSLSIPAPCAEKWNNFTPAAKGGFCGSCAKIVVDFTRMSDDDVVAYFKNKEPHSCGRFRADQLKTYSVLPAARINPGLTLLKAGFVSLLLLLVSRQGNAQTITAKAKTENVQHLLGLVQMPKASATNRKVVGTIKTDEDGQPLPGVNVGLKGSLAGTVSDAEGRFEFPQRLKTGDVLVFSFIGLRTQEYIIPENKNDDEVIVMGLSMPVCELIIMGAAATDGVYTREPSGFSKLWNKVKSIF